jgi:hypothetical protein
MPRTGSPNPGTPAPRHEARLEREQELDWESTERVEQPFDIETEDWENGAYFWADVDPYDDEHLELLKHHPGFRADLVRLWEDIELMPFPGEGHGHAGPLVGALRKDPDDVPVPLAETLAELATKWGVAPLDAVSLVMTSGQKLVSRERSMLFVRDCGSYLFLRIPKPITPPRREAIERLLREERRRRGAFEDRSLSSKSKPGLSPSLIEVLPVFDAWLAGSSPAKLWREDCKQRQAEGLPPLDFESFVQPLIRVWSRLRRISPERLPDKPPSKGSG